MINDAKAVQKEDVLSVFTLLFPGYIAQFLPRSVFFSNSATQHSFVLDDHTFDAFQIIMQEIGGYNSNSKNQELNYNPADEKAAAIAAKLMKGRARVAEIKGEGQGGTLSKYVSILTVAL
jgi:hypothetical protein